MKITILNERIKAARKKGGMTQAQLGIALGLNGPRQRVNDWERGRRTPSVETLGKIADATGTSIDWLSGRTGAKTGSSS